MSLFLVSDFRDWIYPGLHADGIVEHGGDKPFHTMINGVSSANSANTKRCPMAAHRPYRCPSMDRLVAPSFGYLTWEEDAAVSGCVSD